MNVINNDEKSEREFYANSGYNRHINQLTCGITQKDMLALLHKIYTNYQKKNTDIAYHDFKAMVDAFSHMFVQRANEVK